MSSMLLQVTEATMADAARIFGKTETLLSILKPFTG
jgi:hypothetical protein